MTGNKQAFVLATVGTDHHPFDRFVDWIDMWQSRNSDCEVFVQRGTTTRVPKATSAQWLEPGELDAMFRRADAVVCHGGPSTIMEARQAGVVPVVIPRDPSLGEHVDGHQLRFTEFMAAKGAVLAARTEDELSNHLERVAHGDTERIVVGPPTETLDRIRTRIDVVMERPARPLLKPWGRRP